MRRLFAIVIVSTLVFLATYGIVPPVKAAVDGFIIDIVGPAAFSGLSGVVTGIIANLGLTGFAAITMIIGAIGGFTVHLLWVKTDWGIRKWASRRTVKDLGVTPVHESTTATPLTASTRPKIEETPTVIPKEPPQEQETQK